MAKIKQRKRMNRENKMEEEEQRRASNKKNGMEEL